MDSIFRTYHMPKDERPMARDRLPNADRRDRAVVVALPRQVRRLWSSAIPAFGQGPVARHESAASRHAMERDAQAGPDALGVPKVPVPEDL